MTKNLDERRGNRNDSLALRAILETQLALHLLMQPELAADINCETLSARPRELVESVVLGPTLCREIGPRFFVAACMSPATAKNSELLEYVDWLCATPADVRASLPPFDEILAALQGLRGAAAA